MLRFTLLPIPLLVTALLLITGMGHESLAKEAATQTVALAEKSLQFSAPIDWAVVPPKNNLIEKELSVPSTTGPSAARLTIMAAGGSVEANVARWIGQFQGTEGGANRDAAEIAKDTTDGMPITFVTVEGTYLEGRPFGPKTPRPNYQMVAAIVETGFAGNYFFKLIGPKETVDPANESFQTMIRSIEKP